MNPYQLDEEVILLFAGTNGFMDSVSVDRVRAWKEEVLRYMETSYPEIGRDILEKKQITPETDAKLREALKALICPGNSFDLPIQVMDEENECLQHENYGSACGASKIWPR